MNGPETREGTGRRKLVIKAVRPHDTRPGPRDIEDRGRLAEELKGSLDRIRKTAESWRTGMAGLTALVTATLLFKGRASITDYAEPVGYALGALVVLSLALAIASLWRFLMAANGRLAATSAQSILDAGGVDVRNIHLTTTALADLNVARGLGIASAALLGLALLLSWYGPAAESTAARVKLVIAAEPPGTTELSLCGELKALDGKVVVLQVDGEPEPRRLKTERVVSMKTLASCTAS